MTSRFIFLFAVITATAFAADPLELSVLGIADGRVSQKKVKIIRVIVTNVGSDTPVEFTAISIEKKIGDGKFSWFRVDIECPCDAKCRKGPISLKKSESREAEWDFLGGHHCDKADPGIYRFAVAGDGVSKEFTIAQ